MGLSQAGSLTDSLRLSVRLKTIDVAENLPGLAKGLFHTMPVLSAPKDPDPAIPGERITNSWKRYSLHLLLSP